MVTTKSINKTQVKPEYQVLIRFMQRLHFGKIKNLVIRDGIPELRPALDTIKTVKMGCANKRRPEIAVEDFALKSEVRDLFEMIEKIRNGVVSIQVRDGLPFLVKIKGSVSVN
jgi:hypothetical protein